MKVLSGRDVSVHPMCEWKMASLLDEPTLVGKPVSWGLPWAGVSPHLSQGSFVLVVGEVAGLNS